MKLVHQMKRGQLMKLGQQIKLGQDIKPGQQMKLGSRSFKLPKSANQDVNVYEDW